MFNGRQALADALSLFGDALYTKRDTVNSSGRTIFNEDYTSTVPQVTETLGLNWQLGGGWQIETAGSYASEKLSMQLNLFCLDRSEAVSPSDAHSSVPDNTDQGGWPRSEIARRNG